MRDYKYVLEPYKGMSTRYHCPSCQHRVKTFTLYIDCVTGEHIHQTVGRCNRESKCGYHYTPKQYFIDNQITFQKPRFNSSKILPVRAKEKPISFIPIDIFKGSLSSKAFSTNNFVLFLISKFGVEIASELVGRYFIATSKHLYGSTVFWQIDLEGKVRTGKIMLYNPISGKRVHDGDLPVYWVHKAIKQPDFTLKQCLFGEHLLIDKSKPVAIVESEKTAIIASCYLKQFLWLAVGGKSSLNTEICKILKGRDVVLFPDINGYKTWVTISEGLKKYCNVQVSNLLEQRANKEEREGGLDIADYLLRFKLSDFKNEETQFNVNHDVEDCSPKPIINSETAKPLHIGLVSECGIWSKTVNELENYFSTQTLSSPISINHFSVISDPDLFVKSHLTVLRNYDGNRYFQPFLERLISLKSALNKKLHV